MDVSLFTLSVSKQKDGIPLRLVGTTQPRPSSRVGEGFDFIPSFAIYDLLVVREQPFSQSGLIRQDVVAHAFLGFQGIA